MRGSWLLVCGSLLVAGCGLVTSIEPLSTRDDLVFEPALLGAWRDDSATLHLIFTPSEASAYFIAMADTAGSSGRFIGQLTRLNGRLVLDVTPEPLSVHVIDLYKDLLQPLHTFLVLDLRDGRMLVSVLNQDSLRYALQRDSTAPPFTTVDGRLLLTAQQPDLRRFLSKFVMRPGVIDSVTWWRRP